MATNTYLPQVSGVATAVERMQRLLRKQGHDVLAVAPGKVSEPEIDDTGVLRVPALDGAADSGFSLPTIGEAGLLDIASRYRPDIIHSHHPFLIGQTAQAIAVRLRRPLVFTYHTMYEEQAATLAKKPFRDPRSRIGGALVGYAVARQVPILYANSCTAVLAPTKSVADMLHSRGVERPIYVTPTGIDAELFAAGDRTRARARWRVPRGAFVVGYVGRLSPEKNLKVWAEAVARFLAATPHGVALVVGKGSSGSDMRRIFASAGVTDRVRWCGVLRGSDLADAFAALDLFAFASKSETQGLVLAEAMAAGVPAVAFDAPGSRDIVIDGSNGTLLAKDSADALARMLVQWAKLPAPAIKRARRMAFETGKSYSLDTTTRHLAAIYASLCGLPLQNLSDRGYRSRRCQTAAASRAPEAPRPPATTPAPGSLEASVSSDTGSSNSVSTLTVVSAASRGSS